MCQIAMSCVYSLMRSALLRHQSTVERRLSMRPICDPTESPRFREDFPDEACTPSRTFARIESMEDVTVLRYDSPSKSNPFYVVVYPLVVSLSALRLAMSIRSPSTVFHVHFTAPALLLAFFKWRYYYTFHAPAWREISGEKQDTYRSSRRVERPAIRLYKTRGLRFETSTTSFHAE